MDGVNSIPCELCQVNIVRGIVYEIKAQPGAYICEDCHADMEKNEGVYWDGTVMKIVPEAERPH